MTCYNCGYKTSVVSKDDIGWQCEWCSDNELRSPIIIRLKKRIKELKDFRDNAPQYEGSGIVEVNKRLLIQLQEIIGDKDDIN